MRIRLTVNGREVIANAPSDATLLDYLRNELLLSGTKNGCGEGHCGACTVIIDGVARRACITKMARLEGSTVLTIEGLSQGDLLHPIQRAFIEEGAVQCGFCTPGMLMAVKALLDRTPTPTDAEIRKALAHNLCRCTGYVSIIRAVQRAASMLSQPTSRFELPQEAGVVGRSVPRTDAVAKVTGRMVYTDDILMDGLLFGQALRSPLPHARIVSVDVSEARHVPGVEAVLTAADIPGENLFGLIQRDQPVMAFDRVRCVADVLAVVYAETLAAARRAVDAIRVQLEPLPVVSTPKQALSPGVPILHGSSNLLNHVRVRKGDVQAGFARSEVIVEGEYYVPFVEHAYLEPESSVASVDDQGIVSVWCGSQGPEVDRLQIAGALGIDKGQVRVIHQAMGGAFGGKEDISVQILAALGALKTGRPVKMTLNRRESLRASTKRHAMYMTYRTGATRDGKLLAMEANIYADTGAYASVGSAVIFRTASFACGPYVVPNVSVDAYAVYTNNLPCGAMRGFGNPQATFAAELQMDALAERLGLDPWEIRFRNTLDIGDITATGDKLVCSVGIRPTLQAVREELEKIPMPTGAEGKKVGIGIACAYKNVGLGSGIPEGVGAWVGLNEQGYLEVHVGCVDMGQGSDTAMAQIAAQTTGIPYDRVLVFSGDSFRDPEGGMTTASRQTFMSGNAVLLASGAFSQRLRAYVSQQYRVEPEAIELEADTILDRRHERTLCTLAEIGCRAAASGEQLRGGAQYTPSETHANLEVPAGESYDPQRHRLHVAYCFACQAAIVEVDVKSGHVRVLKVVAAQDAGKAINPRAIIGQMEGGVVMGMGYALSEEFRIAEGVILTDTLRKCGLPTIDQTPEIICRIVENPHPEGPLGAKGMGELPMSATAPAIINAIARATGVRLSALPTTPQAVRRSLIGTATYLSVERGGELK